MAPAEQGTDRLKSYCGAGQWTVQNAGQKTWGGKIKFPFLICGKLCLLQAAQVKKKKKNKPNNQTQKTYKPQKLLSVLIRNLKIQYDDLYSHTLWNVVVLFPLHGFLPKASKTGVSWRSMQLHFYRNQNNKKDSTDTCKGARDHGGRTRG